MAVRLCNKNSKGGNIEMKKLAKLFTVVVFMIAFAAPVFAASNEFVEVPAGSWAYDAVARLAAKGYFADYPDGLGGKPITRGEVASLLASALPVDMTQVSEEDADMLEKLVDEVRPELSFLGVGVGALDDVSIFRE
jgi:hypothetical protein